MDIEEKTPGPSIDGCYKVYFPIKRKSEKKSIVGY